MNHTFSVISSLALSALLSFFGIHAKAPLPVDPVEGTAIQVYEDVHEDVPLIGPVILPVRVESIGPLPPAKEQVEPINPVFPDNRDDSVPPPPPTEEQGEKTEPKGVTKVVETGQLSPPVHQPEEIVNPVFPDNADRSVPPPPVVVEKGESTQPGAAKETQEQNSNSSDASLTVSSSVN